MDEVAEQGQPETDGHHFDTGRFREVLGHFATGVTIVTAIEDGEPVGFTCQAFTSLSLEPPLVALAPAKNSTSWPRIARAGAFCVNILAEDQEALCRDFAVSGGDKFRGVGWRPGGSGAPRPRRRRWPGWSASSSAPTTPATTSSSIGRVLDLGVVRGRPLVYYRGGFGRFEP